MQATSLLMALLVALILCASPGSSLEPPPWNVVLLITDDQRWDTVTPVTAGMPEVDFVMPFLQREVVPSAVTFTNAFVTTPLCCPSRASLLSGGFLPARTGVLTNFWPNGGARKFERLERSALAARLQRAGYRTAMIGKYLNEYVAPRVPPGWTEFVATVTDADWYDYRTLEGGSTPDAESRGVVVRHTDQYLTDYQRDRARAFIRRYAAEPFFVYLATNAAHLPCQPEDREDGSRFHGFFYTGRAFAETDLSDKPFVVREEARSFQRQRSGEGQVQRRQLGTLQSLDRAVEKLFVELGALGLLERTIFFFVSDNGYLWGEHKTFRKGRPYEESLRVPLIVRMPGAARAGGNDDRLVAANLDVAATVLDAAGLDPEASDGFSLLPLFADDRAPWPRADIVFENWEPTRQRWAAIRSGRWKYVERTRSGEIELYDLERDGFEKTSVHRRPRRKATIEELRRRLDARKTLTITTPRIPDAVAETPFDFSLSAWGGERPYAWRVVGGALPNGLTLSGDGRVSGTPSETGTFPVTIEVEDQSQDPFDGSPQSFVDRFAVTVSARQ